MANQKRHPRLQHKRSQSQHTDPIEVENQRRNSEKQTQTIQGIDAQKTALVECLALIDSAKAKNETGQHEEEGHCHIAIKPSQVIKNHEQRCGKASCSDAALLVVFYHLRW